MKSLRISITDIFFLALFFILLFVSYLSYKKMDDLIDASNWVNQTNNIKIKLEQTLSDLKDAESGQSTFLLTKDTLFLQPFYGSIQKAIATVSELDSLTRDNKVQQEYVKKLTVLLQDKYNLLNYSVVISMDTSKPSAALLPYLVTGKKKMDEIRDVVSKMINNEDDLLRSRIEEQQKYALATPLFLTSLSLLALGILIISFFKIKNDLNDQRRMKSVLLIQNETFRHAEESASQGTYSWNNHTQTLSFSDNFYKLLGAASGSLQSFDDFMRYVYSADRDHVLKMGGQAFEEKRSLDIRFRIRTKTGEKKYVRATGKTIHSDQFQMMVGTLQDVTTDTLLNEELKQRERQLKQAHLLGKIGVWETNFITGKTHWSDELYQIFGYKPKEIDISETYGSDIHPDDKARMFKTIKKTHETGEAFKTEFRRFDKKGQLKYVYSISDVKKDETGKVIGLFGVSMDITELREKEKQLRESELFNKKVIELLPNIIYIYDLDSKKDIFISGNISSFVNYDMQHEYDENQIMKELIDPLCYDDIKIHHAILRKAPDNEIHELEYRFLFKNGKWKYMLSRDMIFKRNKDGEATQIIGVAIDITELKKSHENLKELNNILLKKNVELEQMNSELASFSYVASHDLQEPLRKIRTFTTLITERDADSLSETAKEYFNRIIAAVGRMQNLIEALLSYSRTNTLETVYETTDLNKLLEEAMNDLNETIREKNAVIESCKLPALKVVPVQFHQLFLNIISNGLKYSKPDEPPHIQICAQLMEGKNIIDFGAQTNIKYWRLSFEDNGIGFEPQYGNKIFELFQRLHGKSEYPGTGIGLAICKKIVLNHDGIITAKSEKGKGSIFEIYIPA